jgi:hypothetical protein
MSPYSEDKLDLLRPMVSHLQKLTEDSVLKFFQVDSAGMFRRTSAARYFKYGVGSSRPS